MTIQITSVVCDKRIYNKTQILDIGVNSTCKSMNTTLSQSKMIAFQQCIKIILEWPIMNLSYTLYSYVVYTHVLFSRMQSAFACIGRVNVY